MSGNDSDLSDAVLDTIRAVHSGVRPPSGFPDPDVLAEIARGQRPEITVRERGNAVAALARHPDGGNDPEIYSQLATDSETPTAVRLSAAAGLRFLPPDRAEPAALELLDSPDSNVVSTAIGTLAVVGREQAFEILHDRFDEGTGTLGDPSTFENVMTGHVAFTRAVIGHRHRLAEAPQFAVEPADRRELEASGLTGSRVDFSGTIQDRTDGPFFGVEPRSDAIELGPGVDSVPPLTVVPDRTVTGAPAEEFTAGPSLWGVVLFYAEEVDRYEPHLLAFATPVEDGVDITVTRVDGKALYAGQGVTDGDRIELSLSDTGLVGTAPTRLRLDIGPDSMTLAEGTVDPEGTVTRTPEPRN